jgi:succinate dehydrogenase/fumarate reductase flavoprotein subunit
MENKIVRTGRFKISYHSVNTLIIGSGAASLNAAVSLHSLGQTNIIVATSLWGGGTSNNAGSDKQTYYKLSLAGDKPDSVAEMANDLFNGKCMHGDIALCEAQGSVQAFMNLVRLGVPFPHNKYGAWAGYKTDHDPRARATSTGPYTSKRMFEALAGEVKRRKIKVLNHHHVISILTNRSRTKVIGALAINKKEKDPLKAFVLFNSANIILGTGGPAGIYETSVYPLSQNGSTGMAFKAGATGQNLTESQFGIASIKFRWNLSGSYQQVIPRYISTDKKGKDEKEFFNDFFPDITTLSKAIFLKGYQWPFDPGKISDFGSSLIDLLVFREITIKGREVYLDYKANPSMKNKGNFSPDNLDNEVMTYLKNSGALKKTPVERLQALNTPAYSLYKENGIDLSRENLQIAVCAQHNNGGLKSDIWWESDLKHLFPVGEVNGSHGVYRPGGSALNSGQVGSYRAALYISKKYNDPVLETEKFLREGKLQIDGELVLANRWLSKRSSGQNERYFTEIRKRMSDAGGIIRNLKKAAIASSEARAMLKQAPEHIGADSVTELADCFQLMDNCLTHFLYIEAIKTYIEKGGRSRGSYLVTEKETSIPVEPATSGWKPDLCQYDRDIEKKIIEIGIKNGETRINLEKVREIPLQDLWFEKVWKEYLEDNCPEC